MNKWEASPHFNIRFQGTHKRDSHTEQALQGKPKCSPPIFLLTDWNGVTCGLGLLTPLRIQRQNVWQTDRNVRQRAVVGFSDQPTDASQTECCMNFYSRNRGLGAYLAENCYTSKISLKSCPFFISVIHANFTFYSIIRMYHFK